MPTKNLETIIEDTQFKIISTQLVAGTSKASIARQLNMTPKALDKILHSEDFRLAMQEYSSSLVNSAANTWKAAMMDRIHSALGVLDHHLKSKNLEAVKVVMKSIGLDKVQAEAPANTAITVVLPGQENVIELKESKNGSKISEGEYTPIVPELPGDGV